MDLTPDKLIELWNKDAAARVPERTPLWTEEQVEQILKSLYARVTPGIDVGEESIMAALALEHEIRICTALRDMLLEGYLVAKDTMRDKEDEDDMLNVDNFIFHRPECPELGR